MTTSRSYQNSWSLPHGADTVKHFWQGAITHSHDIGSRHSQTIKPFLLQAQTPESPSEQGKCQRAAGFLICILNRIRFLALVYIPDCNRINMVMSVFTRSKKKKAESKHEWSFDNYFYYIPYLLHFCFLIFFIFIRHTVTVGNSNRIILVWYLSGMFVY